MTTSKVTQIMSMLKSPELPGMQKQTQGPGLAFGTYLGQTAGNGKQDLLSTESLIQPVRNDSVNQTAYERESAKSGYRENSISRDNPADIQSKLPQDANEKLQAFDKQVKEVIAEKLGISEEEVAQQMEAMGLTAMDLMDPAKLAGLVMELTGSEDIGGLLLDGDFQQMLAQISDLSEGLASQLNLTPEEMSQLAEQLKLMGADNPQGDASSSAGQLSQNAGNISQDGQEVLVEQAKTDANVQSSATTVQTNQQQSADDADVSNQTVRESAGQEENESAVTTQTQEGAQEQGQTESSQTGEKFSDLSKETGGNDKADNKQTHVAYQTTTQTINQGQTVEVTQTVVQTRVDVEDILRQVSQMTRVFVTQAESSVEMQLNPANLGKIYLQVVSREGVITAQIAAQNEAVKEALESQVATLKENMNQQGMKVEAIEVTIASHEFERNLEENQQNAAREQQEEEAAKNARRNLNLNSLDELEGAMSEEESLAAKIMAEQGNSMDIIA
ncbi:MAG: hypothetical protein HFH37_03495 [Lachnospiraceae bacterium]|nr:hypothetical protein [Lachnospiraceae bacterium]